MAFVPDPPVRAVGSGSGRPGARVVEYVVVWSIVAVCALVGGALVWTGLRTPPPDAPTVATGWTLAAERGEPIAARAGRSPVQLVTVADGHGDPGGSGDEGWSAREATSPTESFDDLPVSGDMPSPDAMASGTVLVPTLGIYAPTRPAAIADGELVLPEDPAILGIWSEGSIVLAGHVNQHGRWGALARLATIQPGATLWLRTTDGELTQWRAIGLAATTGKTEHAFFAARDVPRALRVVTCGGPFEGGHYRDNVVVEFEQVTSA